VISKSVHGLRERDPSPCRLGNRRERLLSRARSASGPTAVPLSSLAGLRAGRAAGRVPVRAAADADRRTTLYLPARRIKERAGVRPSEHYSH